MPDRDLDPWEPGSWYRPAETPVYFNPGTLPPANFDEWLMSLQLPGGFVPPPQPPHFEPHWRPWPGPLGTAPVAPPPAYNGRPLEDYGWTPSPQDYPPGIPPYQPPPGYVPQNPLGPPDASLLPPGWPNVGLGVAPPSALPPSTLPEPRTEGLPYDNEVPRTDMDSPRFHRIFPEGLTEDEWYRLLELWAQRT